jgi:hypothetical protein
MIRVQKLQIVTKGRIEEAEPSGPSVVMSWTGTVTVAVHRERLSGEAEAVEVVVDWFRWLLIDHMPGGRMRVEVGWSIVRVSCSRLVASSYMVQVRGAVEESKAGSEANGIRVDADAPHTQSLAGFDTEHTVDERSLVVPVEATVEMLEHRQSQASDLASQQGQSVSHEPSTRGTFLSAVECVVRLDRWWAGSFLAPLDASEHNS